MTIRGDLDDALESTPYLPRDVAALAIARRYADTLDDLFDTLVNDEDVSEDRAAHARVILEITRIGGRFEACLDRLGMSPGARPAARGAGGDQAGGDPSSEHLARLQADAVRGYPAAGVDYAAAVDPAVTQADAAD